MQLTIDFSCGRFELHTGVSWMMVIGFVLSFARLNHCAIVSNFIFHWLLIKDYYLSNFILQYNKKSSCISAVAI